MNKFHEMAESTSGHEHDSELREAENVLAKLSESVGNDPKKADKVVSEFVHDIEQDQQETAESKRVAAETGMLEVLRDENATKTERELNALPLESLGAAMKALESGKGEDAAKIIIDRLDDGMNHRLNQDSDTGKMAHDFASRYDLSQEIEYVTPEKEVNSESIKERVERALEGCDFMRTPEIEKALEGFFTDHRNLIKAVEAVIDKNEIDAGLGEDGTFEIRSSIDDLRRTDNDRQLQLQIADEIVTEQLFAEVSLGATTLSVDEIAQIPKLHQKICDTAVAEGLAYVGNDGYARWRQEFAIPGIAQRELRHIVPSDSEAERNNLNKRVYGDMRAAGQLEFHNTHHMDAIARDGFSLKGRSRQMRETGGYNAMTMIAQPESENHTNAIHWCEDFMPHNYKLFIPQDLKLAKGRRPVSATIAMPLGDIVKSLPYARDSEYGVLEVKEGREIAVPINDGVIFDGNSGAIDEQGESGRDRTFYADYRASHEREAHETELKVFRTSQEGGDHSLLIFTKDDGRRDDISTLHKDDGEGFVDGLGPFGYGDGYPKYKTVSYDNYEFSTSKDPDVIKVERAAREAKLLDEIQQLQKASRERPEYVGKFVVPLRSGVFEFATEGRLLSMSKHKKRNTTNIF